MSNDNWYCGKCRGSAYEHSLDTSTCVWEPVAVARPEPPTDDEREALSEHVEGVMYADDIPEGTDFLPGTTDPIPDDYERHYCEWDGEDWPCSTVKPILDAGYTRVRGPITDEMVEAAAREYHERGNGEGSFDRMADHVRTSLLFRMRAALEAAEAAT